jgi:hypothetical protein
MAGLRRKTALLVSLSLLIISNVLCQQTYTVGATEYYAGRYYKSTGKPMVKRSHQNKQAFLRSRGYLQTPAGYEVDHIIPLSQGGSDAPYNMQLLTVQQHRIKTARERSHYSTPSYSTPPTHSYYNSSYTPTPSYYSNTTYCPSVPSFEITRTRFSSPPPSLPVSTYTPIYQSPSYVNPGLSSGRTLSTGPKGGTYYINSSGNKTYVKRN